MSSCEVQALNRVAANVFALDAVAEHAAPMPQSQVSACWWKGQQKLIKKLRRNVASQDLMESRESIPSLPHRGSVLGAALRYLGKVRVEQAAEWRASGSLPVALQRCLCRIQQADTGSIEQPACGYRLGCERLVHLLESL